MLLRTPCLLMAIAAWSGAAVGQSAPAASSVVSTPVANPKQSAKSVRASAIDAIDDHLKLWNKAWKQSENGRGAYHNPFLRGIYQHCHYSRNAARFEFQAMPEDYLPIGSAYTRFALCPSWFLGEPDRLADEAQVADAAIAPKSLPKVVASRNALLAKLELASDYLPNDGAITGQRVRFLVEASSLDSALSVARFCRADPWWCAVLEGYVQQRRGHMAEAESVFTLARGLLSNNDRCGWEDIQPLIPTYSRGDYARLSCSERHRINEQYWWLADPLLSESGNERRVLHEARRVEAMLHSALAKDARYNWTLRYGGDALAELVQRYGWPSYLGWGGIMLDLNHSNYLRVAGSKESAPYTTYEYSRGRVHTAPDWSVVRDGVHAPVTAWSLNDTLNNNDHPWWPQEHFDRARNLVQLTDMQTAMLRRQSNVILASAHLVDTTLQAALGDGTNAVLVASAGPGQQLTLDQQRMHTGETVVLQGRIRSAPVLAAVEMRGIRSGGRRITYHAASDRTKRDSTRDNPRDRTSDRLDDRPLDRRNGKGNDRVMDRIADRMIDSSAIDSSSIAVDSSAASPGGRTRDSSVAGTDARTRFGIVPPPALDAMKPGEFALSEPILLRVPDATTDFTAMGENVLSQMYGTLRFDQRTRRVGVYWESYGFRPEDSVTVSVQLERHVDVNPLKRIGVALGVAADPNSTVTISWREPDVSHSSRTIAGAVPIQLRALTLDIGNLQRGDYDVVVSVGKIGAPPATNRRRISISR